MIFTVMYIRQHPAMLELLLPAVLCGLCIASVAGPYGCFLVWQRKAFLGDTLAHSALLGVALSLWLSLNVSATTVVTCAIIAVTMSSLERYSRLPVDTILAVFAHTALAGVVAVMKLGDGSINLESYLFGDLLGVAYPELYTIALSVLALGVLLWVCWSKWLAITVNEELAQVNGIHVKRYRFLLAISTATLIALAMKAVGVLLVSALLIIPAASARTRSRSPETMAVLASAAGCTSVLLGMGGAYYFDLPAGPAIVVIAGLGYGCVQLLSRVLRGHR